MSGILVLAEHEGGAFKKTAYELLGKAKELAAALGTSVHAVVSGRSGRRARQVRRPVGASGRG